MHNVFIIDIDHTLVDTDQIKKQIVELISAHRPITYEDLSDSLKSLSNEQGFLPMQQLISSLLKDSAYNEAVVDEVIKKIHKLPFASYIYENVDQALQELFRIGKVVLFSQGEKQFQHAKVASLIGSTQLTEADIYVFEDKLAAIPKLIEQFSAYKMYVFDDHKRYLQKFFDLDNKVITLLIETQEHATDTIDGATFAPTLAAPTFAEAVEKVKEFTSEFIHE